MLNEPRTLQLKRFDSLAEAENYAGEKGELTAVYPQGTNLIRTLFLHNGTAGGGVPVSKMIMHTSSIIYVDAVNGDDTLTDGRGWDSAKPFNTLRAAIYYVHMFVDLQGGSLTIHLAPGQYAMPGDSWQVPFGSAHVTIDGHNDGAQEVVITTNDSSNNGYEINGGLIVFRDIHFEGSGYAVLRITYHCSAIFRNCTIEMTANDASNHTLLYAYDKGYILIDNPITFTSSHTIGDLYVLHATRGGGIQLSNVNDGAVTFNIPNSNKSHFLVATKMASIVTPVETSFTVSGGTDNIQAIQAFEGGRVSGHGIVYNSMPESQPTVAEVLGAGTKAVALAAMDETDEVVYEPDVAYMERQRFFAELDEEYRRGGILLKEN